MPEQKFIEIRGAREHNLKSIDVDIPRDRLVVITGLSRFRQVEPRVRHHLCRGPAALRREPVGVCPAVPRHDAEAGRGPHHRPLAGDLDRTEDHLEEPALHRRHRHRDLRLHAAAVRPRRHPVFTGHRPADRGAADQPDGRHHHGAARRHPRLSAGADRARPQGRVSQGISGPSEARLPARQGQRRVPRPRRAAGARQEIPPQHRRGGGPDRGARGAGDPTGQLPAHRARSRRRHRHPRDGPGRRGRGRGRRTGADHLLREVRLPGLGLHHSRDRAAAVLVQRAVRRLPGLRRAGGRTVLRSAAGGAGREPAADARSDPPLGQGDVAVLPPDHRGHRPALRLRQGEALARPAGAGAPGDALRLGGGEDSLPLRRGRPGLRDRAAVRGGDPEPRAPVSRDGQLVVARGDGALPEQPALRHLRRLSPSAGGAGGEDRRPARRPGGAAVDPRGAGLDRGRARCAERTEQRDRPGDPQGDPRATGVPGQRRARLPHDGAQFRHAVWRREPADPAGEPDRQRPDRGALRARRAVDRAAPARQRPVADHAEEPARLRQHGDRRRARRGGDPRGRPRHRHRPRRRRAWRAGHRRGHAGGHRGGTGVRSPASI